MEISLAATDVSTIEQMAMCLRFCDANETCIREEFVGFATCMATTGEALTESFIQNLNNMGIPIEKMRGQGYDGAANMSGKYNGVQARIKELVPGAEYTHCKAHNLNLCIMHACEESLVRNMIDTAQKIAFVFDYSAKKLAMYKENLWQNEDAKRVIDGQQKLKTLCETRWASRSDALFTFKASLVTVHEVLRVLKSDHSCSDAGAFQAAEEKFDFIVTLVVAEHVLSALMQLSIFLQKKDCDLAIAASESRTVKSILNAGQNDRQCSS